MKSNEVLEYIKSGKIVCVGKYWSGRVETISIRDRSPGSDGRRREAHVVRETVMTDRDPITVTRFMADTEDPQKWKPAAKKLEDVIVTISKMETNLGNVSLTGVVEKLD